MLEHLPKPGVSAVAAWFLGVLFLFTNAASAQCLRTVPVGTSSGLSSAVANALPGDCIVLADGNYSGFTLTRSGNTANPITIQAANQGAATINSGIIKFAGVSNVTVQGLRITTAGGSLTVDGVTRKVGVVLTNGNNCRVTRCTFNLTGQPSGTEWVFLGGNSNSNRVDHCEFGALTINGRYIFPCGNATIAGVTPPADRTSWADGLGPYNPNMSRYTRIDHNYFHDHVSATTNAISESIVLGGIGVTGDYQGTFSTVEYNLFVNCDGDNAEIISTKSSTNTLRYNTVVTSAGHFSLRAGNGSAVYGNFFLQGGQGGGIKLSERDHRIYNNYIENTDGSSYPIMFENGDPYTATNFSHAQVLRCWTVHNTVVSPGRQVLIGHNSSSPLKPTDCVFADNIISGTIATLYSEDHPTNLVRLQNIVWSTNPNKPGLLFENPQLATVGNLQKLSSASPAINAADRNYDAFVADDMDGQARDSAPDIGADEFSGAAITRRALTTNDVGPNAYESDFLLAADPASQSAVPGTNVSYAVTLTPTNDFSGNVNLSVAGLPPGAGAAFSPNPVTGSGVSTLTVTASNNIAPGNYPLTITGTSGSLAHSASVTLSVSDFMMGVTPPSQGASVGGGAGYTVTVGAGNGFSGIVTLDVSGLPPGADYTLSETNIPTPGTAALSVTLSTSVAVGDYPFTISGADGSLTRSAGATLSVNDFAVAATPDFQPVLVGSGASYTVTVVGSNGFSGTVTLSVSGLPAGAGYTLSQTNINGPGAATLTVTVPDNVAVGDSQLTVTGTSGGMSRNATVALRVTDFAVAAVPSAQTVRFDESADYTVNVTGTNGFNGTVTLSVTGLPPGSGCSLTPTDVVGSGASTLRVSVSDNVVPGSYPLTLTGLSGGMARTGVVALIVVPPANLVWRGSTSSAWDIGVATNWLNVDSNAIVTFQPGDNVLFDDTSGVLTNVTLGTGVTVRPRSVTVDVVTNGYRIGGGGSIGGAGSLLKDGTGTLELATANGFTGDTVVNAGTLALSGGGALNGSGTIRVVQGAILDVSGRADGALTLAIGQTLTGQGTVAGTLVVSPGATVSLGNNAVGRLTVTNAAVLGGTTILRLDAANGTNDVMGGAASVIYGGGLRLTNLAGPLVVGSRFKLFDASAYSGAFASILPAAPGNGLSWDTGRMTNDGTLQVVASAVPPTPDITGMIQSGAGAVITGTNGVPGGTYRVLTTTNATLRLANWSVVATNRFDGNGNFTFTNDIEPSRRARFFGIQVP